MREGWMDAASLFSHEKNKNVSWGEKRRQHPFDKKTFFFTFLSQGKKMTCLYTTIPEGIAV